MERAPGLHVPDPHKVLGISQATDEALAVPAQRQAEDGPHVLRFPHRLLPRLHIGKDKVSAAAYHSVDTLLNLRHREDSPAVAAEQHGREAAGPLEVLPDLPR